MTNLNSINILKEYSSFIESSSKVKEIKNGYYISLPFLYSGDHFVELCIKQLNEDLFMISDLGNVLIEIESSGIPIFSNKKRKEILLDIIKKYQLNLEGVNLKKTSSKAKLAQIIHSFIEAIKAISDLTYFHEAKIPKESIIHQEIKHVLDHKKVKYLEYNEARIDGVLEKKHRVDFLIENKRPEIIVEHAGENTKMMAEVWGFRFSDIKDNNPTVSSYSVYDVDSPWTDTGLNILKAKSDYLLSSTEIYKLDKLISI